MPSMIVVQRVMRLVSLAAVTALHPHVTPAVTVGSQTALASSTRLAKVTAASS